MADKALCSIPDCDKPTYARQVCRNHYDYARNHGIPLPDTIKRVAKYCSIKGCSNRHEARGYCKLHWQRWRAGKDLHSPRRATRIVFEAEVSRAIREATPDKCWIWPHSTNSRGYAFFHRLGKTTLVHREICERIHGRAPTETHHAAHNCGRGKYGCINPHHVQWKTPSENEADKVAHNTSNRGERCGSAILTRDQVLEIRRLRATGMKYREIAALFSVRPGAIASIITGKNWRWLV